MYAIIETGGKQYRAEPHAILQVELLGGDVGSIIQFDAVRFLQTDQVPIVGTPTIPQAIVKGEILRHARTRSITVFKKKRRKNYPVPGATDRGLPRYVLRKLWLRPNKALTVFGGLTDGT